MKRTRFSKETHSFYRLVLLLVLVVAGLMASGCTTTGNDTRTAKRSSASTFFSPGQDGPGRRHLVEKVIEPVPLELPRSRYGNPKTYEVAGQLYETMDSSLGYRERGIASWYGSKFHGRLTSSREVYDMYQLTAAHRSLPIPTFVEVTNLENGKSLIVKVNDRGPFHDDRLIDLSYAAAVKLDVIDKGTAPVEVRAIDPVAEKRQYKPVQISEIKVAASQVPPIEANASVIEVQHKSPVEDGGMYVQLGAFSEQGNAMGLKQKVEALIPGASVDILPAVASGIYRVQLGPLYSTSLITEIIHELDRGGIQNYHLVSH